MPGSTQTFPGEYTSLAAGFASGKPLDVAPGRATLSSFLEDAAGDDDRYAGASDDELQGVICAWDRAEAAIAADKHAAVAELIRRHDDALAEADQAQQWTSMPARRRYGWSASRVAVGGTIS